jgi:limonene-1,2-epoxide hydrolase
MNDYQQKNEAQSLPPLRLENVLQLWSKTYNTSGKPDWSHIFPYYDEQIIFEDTVQKVTGKADFLAMCNRLTERCETLNMEILAIAGQETVIFMEWIMTMTFRKTPSTPLHGCTKLTLGENGMIIHQRDYYDLWGDIFENVPAMKKIYPRFMKRLFG